MNRLAIVLATLVAFVGCGDDGGDGGTDPVCGNGMVETGEQCDDGNNTDGDGCQTTCDLPSCGDGIVDMDEACDDGNNVDDDGCQADCTIPASCGDGTQDPGEECDDGNNIDGDGCQADCALPVCGDGIVDSGAGEMCDDGNDIDGDGCQATCLLPVCGDGVMDADIGEECDDGNNDDGDGCQADCSLPACGDGIVDPGEMCDDMGESAACDFDCTFATCGDGTTNPTSGEMCDTAGDSATCDADCTFASCGDGTLNMPAGEECDDGNNNDGDGCQANCALPVCGDGIVDVGAGEECDDGNTTDGDGCQANCALPVCGDGIVDVGAGEECDDGNATDGDGCQTTCLLPVCGDSIVDAGEFCDDGNNVDGDGCSATCAFEVMVGTGREHTCALLNTGGVRCWGRGQLGAIGYGTLANVGDTAATIPSIVGDVAVGGIAVRIAVGNFHTCALLDTGNVRCWGLNNAGQLGYGHVNRIGDDELPSSAGDVSVGGTVVDLVAGGFHTCALLDTGDVRCWGQSDRGQLGYGDINSIGDNELPSSVGPVSVGGTVARLTLGERHTCALLTTGNVRCWGDGQVGALGYGNGANIGDNELPSSVGTVSVGGLVSDVSAGGFHTCALLTTGDVRCWGQGTFGRLGYGNEIYIGDTELPSSIGVVPVGGPVAKIEAGREHTCALLATGELLCWGRGDGGRLGYGNIVHIGDNEPASAGGPVSIGGMGTIFQIIAGGEHTCVLFDSHAIRCWGNGGFGRLGYGNTATIGDNELPSSVMMDVPYL